MMILVTTFLLALSGCTYAGPGGYLYMINLSGSNWKLSSQSSHKMKIFNFPSEIKNGTSEQIYIEFEFYRKQQFGSAYYQLDGLYGKSFQIVVRGKPNKISAIYNNLEGIPNNKEQQLGWRHNGEINFAIIYKCGTYKGTYVDGSNWMRDNIGWLGDRQLKMVSIPGSHDSGMSCINGHTAFAKACNTQTQGKNFLQQLKLGVRYFDVRPVIGNVGKYLTGHYTQALPSTYQGANGESIDSLVNALNEFTTFSNELIIITLSHTYNTDIGNEHYRKFTSSEWEGLFNKLDNIKNLYHNDDVNTYLPDFTLNNFTQNGTKSSVVLLVDDPDIDLGTRSGRGYFLIKNMNIYNDYSDTNNWKTMVNDQIQKMNANSKTSYFLMSWTLTQSYSEAVFCSKSIRDLARGVDYHLPRRVYEAVNEESFPNIIYTDFVMGTDVTSLSLAINAKVLPIK